MLNASPPTTNESARALLARAQRRAVIAAGLLAFAWHGLRLVHGGTFYGLDFTRCDVGFICAIREGLARGDSLFANAFIGNGLPLALAPEAQLFSVVRWLSLLFTPDLAASLGVVVHFALAASAMAALVLTFRVSPVVAMLAGVCAVLAGPVVDLTYHGMYIAGAVAIPLTWASARVALRRREQDPVRGRAAVGIAAGLVFAMLGGEPQAAAIALATVVLEILFAVFSRRHEGARTLVTHAALPALACVAGMLIGSFPWWGTLAELALTHRDRGLVVGEALRQDIGPAQLVKMFWPGLTVSTHTSSRTLFGVLFPETPGGWIAEPYLGGLLFAFVVVGWLSRGARRRGAPALVTAAVGALFAAGSHTPFMPALVTLVPAFATFRFPAKYLVVTTLALVVLAALGADALARRKRAALPAAVVFAGVVLAAITGVLVPSPLLALDDELLMHLREHAITEAGLATAALFFVLLRRARAFALVVLACDLALVSLSVMETGPALAPAPSIGDVVHTVVSDRVPVVCMTQAMHQNRFLDEPSWRRGQSRFFRTWLVTDLQACDALSSAVPYSVLASRMHHALVPLLERGSMSAARALACDVTVSDIALDTASAAVAILDAPRIPPTPEDESTRARTVPRLTVVPDARPEVTVARAPELIGDEARLLARILSSTDAATLAALVDDPLARLVQPTLPDGARVTRVDVDEARSDDVTFTLDGEGGAVVVWRRLFAVGWRAEQAGHALPVVRASGTSLAVVVDDVTRGPVTLTYQMPRRELAWLALVAGLALLLAMEKIARTRQRQPPASTGVKHVALSSGTGTMSGGQ